MGHGRCRDTGARYAHFQPLPHHTLRRYKSNRGVFRRMAAKRSLRVASRGVRAVTIPDGRIPFGTTRPGAEGRRAAGPGPRGGLNGADMQQVAGAPGAARIPADIPGLELAGEVAAAGHEGAPLQAGDRVMAIVGGGGQAELAVVHERVAMPVPDGLDWPEAGGSPRSSRPPTTPCSPSAASKAGRPAARSRGGRRGRHGRRPARRAAAGALVMASVRNDDAVAGRRRRRTGSSPTSLRPRPFRRDPGAGRRAQLARRPGRAGDGRAGSS